MLTMVAVVRELIMDNNPDATKRIFSDEEVTRCLKTYMTTYEKRYLNNLDGLKMRYESKVPYWLDGCRSHLSNDETTEFLFESKVYSGADATLVSTTDYVVDTNNGVLIFTSAQTTTRLVATFYATNPYHAGADLLDELAAKKARSALSVQLGALSVNLLKLSRELREQAEWLRGQGGPVVGTNMRSDMIPRRTYPHDTNFRAFGDGGVF